MIKRICHFDSNLEDSIFLFRDSAQTSNNNNVKRPGEEENSTTNPRSPVPDQRPCAPDTKQGLFSCLLSGFDSWLIKKMTLN